MTVKPCEGIIVKLQCLKDVCLYPEDSQLVYINLIPWLVVHILKLTGMFSFHSSFAPGYSCLPFPPSPRIVSWCPVDQTAGLSEVSEKSGVQLWVGVCKLTQRKPYG